MNAMKVKKWESDLCVHQKQRWRSKASGLRPGQQDLFSYDAP